MTTLWWYQRRIKWITKVRRLHPLGTMIVIVMVTKVVDRQVDIAIPKPTLLAWLNP